MTYHNDHHVVVKRTSVVCGRMIDITCALDYSDIAAASLRISQTLL